VDGQALQLARRRLDVHENQHVHDIVNTAASVNIERGDYRVNCDVSAPLTPAARSIVTSHLPEMRPPSRLENRDATVT
jgi:hypothetical protein